MSTKADVLLVYANPVVFPFAQPYGLSIIKAHLSVLNIASRIVLPFQSASPDEYIRSAIGQSAPKIIGLSFRNLDTAGFGLDEKPSTFFSSLESIVAACRSADPEVLLVLGGSGFSVDPYTALRKTGVRIGFVGPSEAEFAAFVADCLGHLPSRPVDVLALANRYSSCIVNLGEPALTVHEFKESLRRPTTHLPKQLPSAYVPYGIDPLALEFSDLLGANLPVRTKTGCSLRCIYCVVPYIERLSLRQIPHVIEDLRAAARLGYGKRLFIADGEFNLPSLERALAICDAIKSEFGSSLRWRCYVCPSEVSEELASSMAEAGCISVGLAVDSLSDDVRLTMKKRCTADVAMTAVRSFLKAGVETIFTLLFGAPQESLASALESSALARELVIEGSHVSNTVGLRIYPNTPLDILAHHEIYRPFVSHPDSDGRPMLFCSPIPRAELYAVLQDVFAGLPRVHWTAPIDGQRLASYRLLAHLHDMYRRDHHETVLNEIARHEVGEVWPQFALLKAKTLRHLGRLDQARDTLLTHLESERTPR